MAQETYPQLVFYADRGAVRPGAKREQLILPLYFAEPPLYLVRQEINPLPFRKDIVMQHINRKSAPQVVKGRVQKKNNLNPSTDYYDAPLPGMVLVDRKRPGEGYKHVLNKSDIYQFLELLPDWKNLAVGLNAVVLAPGEWSSDGYHTPGVVHICAWEEGLWREMTGDHYRAHQDIFERLGIIGEETCDEYVLCKFDESAVRGYQLLHILLHELGHHHDLMTTRSQKKASRGEKYAEDYARTYENSIWQQYQKAFRL